MHKKKSAEQSEGDIGASLDSYLDAFGVAGIGEDDYHPAHRERVLSQMAVMEEEQPQSEKSHE